MYRKKYVSYILDSLMFVHVSVWLRRKDQLYLDLNFLANCSVKNVFFHLSSIQSLQQREKAITSEKFLDAGSSKGSLEVSPHLPMVVMMVPQKKAAEDMSQWLVKFSGRLLTSRPASTADITLCREGFTHTHRYPLTQVCRTPKAFIYILYKKETHFKFPEMSLFLLKVATSNVQVQHFYFCWTKEITFTKPLHET